MRYWATLTRLATLVQVVGACLYAAIFSNVAKLIEKLDAAGNRFSAALDKISEFAKVTQCPSDQDAPIRELFIRRGPRL